MKHFQELFNIKNYSQTNEQLVHASQSTFSVTFFTGNYWPFRCVTAAHLNLDNRSSEFLQLQLIMRWKESERERDRVRQREQRTFSESEFSESNQRRVLHYVGVVRGNWLEMITSERSWWGSEALVVRPVCVLSLEEMRVVPKRTLTPDQWWQTAGRRAVCPVCVVRQKVVQGKNPPKLPSIGYW